MTENISRFQAGSSQLLGAMGALPQVSGRLARSPFRWTKRDRDSLPVRLDGQLPEWLKGQLVRTALALFELGTWRAEHWFDGLGLIYGFSFENGVSFQQNLLESAALKDAQTSRPQIATFNTPTKRSFWQRLFKPVPQITDNANVNIVPFQGAWLAMTESPSPHMIDGRTLSSQGIYRWDDKLSLAIQTAHPHFDFERKEMVNVGASFGPKNVLSVITQGAASHTRKVESTLSLKRVPYMHAFGLSSRHAVLIDHPFTLNPLHLLFRNQGFISPFEWEQGRGTRLWKLDRAVGKWSCYETRSLFCFHIVNTYDDGDDVVMDFIAYDDPGVIAHLQTENLNQRVPKLAPRLVRARLTPHAKQVDLEVLMEEGFEFPAIAYRERNGRPYQTAWGVQLDESAANREVSSRVVRVEPERGEMASFAEDHMTYGEPVFVPRPGATQSGDGVLLCVGSHAEREQTTLAVLEARTLAPLAHAHVDLCIPLGFHGSYLGAT